MKKIIIVCGATASGKTSFAIDLAKEINSEIISCDSMQIYKDMNIGTAKTTKNEMQGIKHFMLDIVDAKDEYSVSEYVKSAEQIIETICSQDKVPIIVGGTGLYVDGLIYPMTFCGDKNEEVTMRLTKEYEQFGAEFMHDKLKKIDSKEAEKIHCNNKKRLIRALEIYEVSGKIKNANQEKELGFKYEVFMIFLNYPREVLYEKINKRVQKMFDDGLVKEIQQLLEEGVTWDSQSMQAIGYKEFKGYFENILSLDEVKEQIKINTRHYAKRQICWFKKYDFAKIVDCTLAENVKKVKEEAIKFSKSKL